MKVEINAKAVIAGLIAMLGSGGLYSGFELYSAYKQNAYEDKKKYELLLMDRDILQCDVAAIKRYIIKKEKLKNDCWKIPIKRFRGEAHDET